jgi:hypothetical protein
MERDAYPIDLAAHRRRFGAAVDAVMPPGMRSLNGRRLISTGFIKGIPARFWEVDAPFDEDDEEA